MKEEYVKFMELVASMRRLQRSEREAGKIHDYNNQQRFHQEAIALEVEVDVHVQDRLDPLKNGEQRSLFKGSL